VPDPWVPDLTGDSGALNSPFFNLGSGSGALDSPFFDLAGGSGARRIWFILPIVSRSALTLWVCGADGSALILSCAMAGSEGRHTVLPWHDTTKPSYLVVLCLVLSYRLGLGSSHVVPAHLTNYRCGSFMLAA
jgi:hypothetical protein